MSTIVITEQGSHLTKKGGRIILFKEGKKIYVQPMANLTMILIMGRVEVSAALMAYTLQKGIEISFLSIDGRYKGRLMPAQSKNVLIRKIQYQNLDNTAFKLDFARAVIAAKTANYGRMVQKKARVAYENFKSRLQNMRSSLKAAQKTEEIRGLEGSFSRIYFQNLPAMVIEDFGFKKRIKHPPPDPMNILLSLAYTMLFNNVYAFVEAAGLDPYCGYFHELKYGHPALVSDLMEEFRAPVADTLVISLINRRKIVPVHFIKEKDKTVFTKEGLTIFFEQYRKKVTEKFGYKNLQLNYLQIIERQVWHFMRVLKEEDSVYEGYRSG